MISIRNLNKYFNKGRQNQIHVINNVSIDLPDKGMVAIFGRSGCGKTTLLNVIGGLDKFGSGSVTVDGKSIRKGTDVLRNKYVGYVFQNYNLNKDESCFDNVADALRLCGIKDEKVIESRVAAALANVDMDKYSKRTPDTLSGGQQQRIAIARAIVKNPRIILADEPTGNLDEANTVMIMDMLKAISRDHLVVLVTHEAELVDYYCDSVIELRDGSIVGMRNNDQTDGLAVRDKNVIYLGELDKTELSDGNTQVEYYGKAPASPVKLTVVNNGGRLYVKIDTPKVQVLDSFSEVKLKDGVFEKRAARSDEKRSFDTSALPPVEGTRFGRLFSLGSSIKSGYAANFKNRHKGKKLLRICMCLFAAVLVLMSAVFGTAFDKLFSASRAYNHNVFYVYTPDSTVSEKIFAAMGDGESGIDYASLYYGTPSGDQSVTFRPGTFESFSASNLDNSLRTNAVHMSGSIAKDYELLAGKSEGLSDYEMLISSQVADELIENSSYGYLSDYDDLVGLICSSISIDGKNLSVAGVVKAKESAVYLAPLAMAKYTNKNSPLRVDLASAFDIDVPVGKTVYVVVSKDIDSNIAPEVGKTVSVQGVELEVTEHRYFYTDYNEWLKAYYPDIITDEGEYFLKTVSAQYPELDGNELQEKIDYAYETQYFDYVDYKYLHFEEYLTQYALFADDIDPWLYLEKGIKEVKYFMMPEGKLYQAAVQYKEANGSYPTLSDAVNSFVAVDGEDLEYVISMYRDVYWNEYYSRSRSVLYENCYLVNDNDYMAFSTRKGVTHESAVSDKYLYGIGVETFDISLESLLGTSSLALSSEQCYTLIHSSSPRDTSKWIKANFSELDPPAKLPATLTPTDIFLEVITDSLKSIVVSSVAMGVVMIMLCVCMYFIMRSSLMNRIKEVGIYRAIGVSKRNLIFKFTVEAVVLTTLTVFIGYLVSGAFIGVCLGISPLVESVFYYPLWYAGAMLLFLFGMCVILGSLPIIMLLRKTPSQILAKYDI